MNKIFFILFFGLLHLNIFADNISLIYIDLSDRPNLESVIEITEQIVSSSKGEFLVFVSNGDEPILINDFNKISEELRKINVVPSTPTTDVDINKLNDLITEKGFLKNNQVTFNFLLTANNRANIFINRFLLTNRLISREGLIKDINVGIYPFGDKETEEYKSICKIFKEKKYDIKN